MCAFKKYSLALSQNENHFKKSAAKITSTKFDLAPSGNEKVILVK